MPTCGSQIVLCDLPIRIDSYKGCSHACRYCFVKRGRSISDIKVQETAKSLRNFISGERRHETNWCDWNIPIHWGGCSDPFQPCEKIKRISFEMLKVFAETQYPFVVSTKGKLIGEDEYINLLEKCNCVVQISMLCSKYDKLESGCPTFEERLKILSRISKRVKRTIVRAQPLLLEIKNDLIENIIRFKNAGAYGVIIEGMKFIKKTQGTIKLGGDFVYEYEKIKNTFLEIKNECHKQNLKCYAGENRLRRFGDSLCCCGIDGLADFKGNHFNLNHIYADERPLPTEKMQQAGTSFCFRGCFQNAGTYGICKKTSLVDWMYDCAKRDLYKEILGMKTS